MIQKVVKTRQTKKFIQPVHPTSPSDKPIQQSYIFSVPTLVLLPSEKILPFQHQLSGRGNHTQVKSAVSTRVLTCVFFNISPHVTISTHTRTQVQSVSSFSDLQVHTHGNNKIVNTLSGGASRKKSIEEKKALGKKGVEEKKESKNKNVQSWIRR